MYLPTWHRYHQSIDFQLTLLIFELTCDIVSWAEINDIGSHDSFYAGLPNTGCIVEFGSVVLKIARRAEGAGYRTICRTAFCRMLIRWMSICRMRFANVSFADVSRSRSAKSRDAICRHAFLPTCKKSKCQLVEMSIRRNATLSKC